MNSKNNFLAMELLNPEKYKGFYTHPCKEKTIYCVVSASIKPDHMTSCYLLSIYFENGKHFFTWSPSIKGAKQCFAFQCSKGSKWRV